MTLNNAGQTLCVYKGKAGTLPASCTFMTLSEKQDLNVQLLNSIRTDFVSGTFVSPNIIISPDNETALETFAKSILSDIQSGIITEIDNLGAVTVLNLPKSIFTENSNRSADMHEYIDSSLAEFRWNFTFEGKLAQIRVQISKISEESEIHFTVVINFSPMFGSLFSLSELCVQTTKTVLVLKTDNTGSQLYNIDNLPQLFYPITNVIKSGNSYSLRTVANNPQMS